MCTPKSSQLEPAAWVVPASGKLSDRLLEPPQFPLISPTASATTTYLVVHDVNYGGAPGAYGLEINVSDLAAIAMAEPVGAHDAPSTAVTIGSGTLPPVVVTGDLTTTSEVDVYRIAAFTGEVLEVSFTALAHQQLEVLDDMGNVLATVNPGARNHTANAAVATSGDRYLRVTFPVGVTKTPGGYTLAAFGPGVSVGPVCGGT
jgi:hypothetical protein